MSSFEREAFSPKIRLCDGTDSRRNSSTWHNIICGQRNGNASNKTLSLHNNNYYFPDGALAPTSIITLIIIVLPVTNNDNNNNNRNIRNKNKTLCPVFQANDADFHCLKHQTYLVPKQEEISSFHLLFQNILGERMSSRKTRISN